MMQRRGILKALVAGSLLLGAVSPVLGQTDNFPSRPASMVVGWSPGGATDILARQLVEAMSAVAGESFVVENRPGANGTIGHGRVARERPDGYTSLLATNSTFAIAPHLYENLPFEQEKDFAPVSLLAESPLLLVASTQVGVENLDELVQKMSEQEGGLNVASGGNGSTSHMAAEMLMSVTGSSMTHIPYKGGGPAAAAIASGEVDVAFLDFGVALPFLKSGQAVPIGVTSAERSPLLAEVPSLQEAGLDDFVATTTFGLFVPADTPAEVVDRLSSITQQALKDSKLSKQLESQGVVVIGTDAQGLADYVNEETRRWGELIEERDIKIE